VALRSLSHQRFADAYLKHGNAAEAAREAGYKCKNDLNFANTGHRLLKIPDIQQYIAEQRAVMDGASTDSALLIRDSLKDILSTTITDFCSWREDGIVQFKPSDKLTPAQARRIKRIRGTHRVDPEGAEVTSIDIELFDPMSAAKLLADIDGLTGDINVSIANLAKYGINVKRDGDNWTIEKG
jgi:hypothetical protein